MTRLVIISVVFSSLIASGCQGKRNSRAIKFAEQISNSISDSATLALINDSIMLWCDSINTESEKSQAIQDFYAEASIYGDSVAITARTMVLSPTQMGSALSSETTTALTDGSKTASDIASYLNTVHRIYRNRGQEELTAEFDKAYQAHIDSLSIKEQMLIYSKSCPPSQLGKFLHDDHRRNPEMCNQAVDALKEILNDEDYAIFIKSYNSK